MKYDGKQKRLRERLELQLPVRVQCRESLDHEWVELTRLLDVTPFGSRFTLTRPSEEGRLLHMTLPMPRQLRCFDHVEQQYKVWALVRHMRPLPPVEGKPQRYEIGVAFVGKRAPLSFENDPTKRYEVAESPTETGMWSLRERTAEDDAARYDGPDRRPETRLNMPVEVIVEVFDEKGNVAERETTVTENISRRGAAVFTSLNIARGRFVRLTSVRYQISVIAAVRGRRSGSDNIPRLHLEFVSQQWPLEGFE